MKFAVGFLAGIVVGAVGAVAYSVQTGKDLREIADEIRTDLSKGDLDALGARLESRFGEMQRDLEARIATVREKAQGAIDEANAVAAETAAKAEAAAEAGAQGAGELAETAREAAAEGVGEVQDAAQSAAEDVERAARDAEGQAGA